MQFILFLRHDVTDCKFRYDIRTREVPTVDPIVPPPHQGHRRSTGVPRRTMLKELWDEFVLVDTRLAVVTRQVESTAQRLDAARRLMRISGEINYRFRSMGALKIAK
jgi:hypothetical protein